MKRLTFDYLDEGPCESENGKFVMYAEVEAELAAVRQRAEWAEAERDMWKDEAAEVEAKRDEAFLANRVLHGAYLRIRKLLDAWNTPTAPTVEQVHEYVEDCVRAMRDENAALRARVAELEQRT